LQNFPDLTFNVSSPPPFLPSSVYIRFQALVKVVAYGGEEGRGKEKKYSRKNTGHRVKNKKTKTRKTRKIASTEKKEEQKKQKKTKTNVKTSNSSVQDYYNKLGRN